MNNLRTVIAIGIVTAIGGLFSGACGSSSSGTKASGGGGGLVLGAGGGGLVVGAGGFGAVSSGGWVGSGGSSTVVVKDNGQVCTANGECRSGYCNLTTHLCDVNPTGCIAVGAACTSGTQCCTTICSSGACQPAACTPDNGACTFSGACCSGACNAGACVPGTGCKAGGNTCSFNSDCCSLNCVAGQCAAGSATGDGGSTINPASFCGQNGDRCTADINCCGGLCASGSCSTVTASGAGGGDLAGEICGGTYTSGSALPVCGGSCASRSCLPGPTGVLICQPPSGCHPTGELCRTDVDCCGSATLPDGDLAKTSCSKDPGAAFGLCNQGNSCSPAGSICRLDTASCNATATCCAGNVHQVDVCHLDNLGIPRCLIAPVDCTNPQSYVGKACASSADCCNLPCVPNPSGTPPFICGSACVPEGGTCTTTADCCAGIPCQITPGSTSGICKKPVVMDAGPPPPPPCAEYGQACTVTADCCNGVPCTTGFCMVGVG